MGFLQGTWLALVFSVTALGTLAGTVAAMNATDTNPPAVGLNLMHTLAPQIRALRHAGRASSARQIVFLGDSISISTTGDARPVPQLLRRELKQGEHETDVELHSLAALGTGPFDYYFLADVIADAGADEVVIGLSLNAFGESFRSMNRREISGFLGQDRLIEAALKPIHWIGLTYDELLMNSLIIRAGGFESWRSLAIQQARLGTMRTNVAHSLGAAIGGRGPKTFQLARFTHDQTRTRLPGLDRYTAASELKHYGPVLVDLAPDHPVLKMLAGAIEHFSRSRIATLVYVNPINVEHLAAVGTLPSAALSQSLDLVRATVESAGGRFVDLHALLPDAAFRDAAGHFGGGRAEGSSHDGTKSTPSGTHLIAETVAQVLRSQPATRRTP